MDGRLGLSAAAACRLGMAFRIAVPAAMPAAAAPIVIIIIVARPRAGEPALVVPRKHRAAAIIIIVAIACARTAAFFLAAPRWPCESPTAGSLPTPAQRWGDLVPMATTRTCAIPGRNGSSQ